MEDNDKRRKHELFSTSVKAGKRTYFFDVKLTRNKDYFLTISERKKKFNKNSGRFEVEKHRIFLYQEDFEDFINALNNTLDYINQHGVDEEDAENIITDENDDVDEVNEIDENEE